MCAQAPSPLNAAFKRWVGTPRLLSLRSRSGPGFCLVRLMQNLAERVGEDTNLAACSGECEDQTRPRKRHTCGGRSTPKH